MITLITGGMRSGKSNYALELAKTRASRPAFIATAEAFDQETKNRIEKHRAERNGKFFTYEEPVELAEAVEKAGRKSDLILIDCLTFWINNLLFRDAANDGCLREKVALFLEKLKTSQIPVIVVTNEVGLGIIPENPLSRQFIEILGRLNQDIAAIAEEVVFMAAGLPQILKGNFSNARLER